MLKALLILNNQPIFTNSPAHFFVNIGCFSTANRITEGYQQQNQQKAVNKYLLRLTTCFNEIPSTIIISCGQ